MITEGHPIPGSLTELSTIDAVALFHRMLSTNSKMWILDLYRYATKTSITSPPTFPSFALGNPRLGNQIIRTNVRFETIISRPSLTGFGRMPPLEPNLLPSAAGPHGRFPILPERSRWRLIGVHFERNRQSGTRPARLSNFHAPFMRAAGVGAYSLLH